METQSEPSNVSGRIKNVWHFVQDDGNTYYVSSETEMPAVEELLGMKSNGTSILKEFLNQMKINKLLISVREKFEANSPTIPVSIDVVEESVLYSPCGQYASCTDCAVLCDIKSKCPMCCRRILLPRILKAPSANAISVDMSNADVSIFPDNAQSANLVSGGLQKEERNEKGTTDSEIDETQVVFVDANIEQPVVSNDVQLVLDIPGPSTSKRLAIAHKSGTPLVVRKSSVANATAQSSKEKRPPVKSQPSPSLIHKVLSGSKLPSTGPEPKKQKLDQSIPVIGFGIDCHTIKIGSHTVQPSAQVIFTPQSVSMEVPTIDFAHLTNVKLDIGSDVKRVSMHIGKSACIVIMEVCQYAATLIREKLKMTIADLNGPWFSPLSDNLDQRNINLCLKDSSADSVNRIKQIFTSMKITQPLSEEEVSEILKRATSSSVKAKDGSPSTVASANAARTFTVRDYSRAVMSSRNSGYLRKMLNISKHSTST